MAVVRSFGKVIQHNAPAFGMNTSPNRLLNSFSNEDRVLLDRYMRRLEIVRGEILEKANKPIKTIYFPEDGLVSVAATSRAKGWMHIGMIGNEGMTGIMVVLGNDRSPLETLVQVAGSAMVINADDLRNCMKANQTIRDVLLKYVPTYLIQISQTAVANVATLLTQRLARWLLMCEDRLTSKHIPLTHEFLSIMLGAQRAGVTIALNELERRGFIKGERGLISILDRSSLIKLTDGAYGLAEREYERLFTTGSAP